MIVVEKYKLVYCHIPKTGGSAITGALGKHVDCAPPVPLKDDGRFWQYRYHARHRNGKTPMHTTCWNTEVDLSKYFVAAAVRNPWAWIACQYTSWHRRRLDYDAQRVAADPPAVKGLKAFFAQFSKSGTWNYGTSYCSQREYLYDKPRGNGRFVPNMILKFEQLQEDFDRLCDEVGMPAEKLGRRNLSVYPVHPNKLYDIEACEMVGEFFKRDCELFKYEYPWKEE